MEEFLELKTDEAFVLTGAGVAMSIDSNGETFYVLHLAGYAGNASDISDINVVVPSMATEQFLRVAKAMEAKRE